MTPRKLHLFFLQIEQLQLEIGLPEELVHLEPGGDLCSCGSHHRSMSHGCVQQEGCCEQEHEEEVLIELHVFRWAQTRLNSVTHVLGLLDI